MPETGAVANNCGGVIKPMYIGKGGGDANCDGLVNGVDYSIWRKEYIDICKTLPVIRNTWEADFNCDGTVGAYDYSLWRRGYRNGI